MKKTLAIIVLTAIFAIPVILFLVNNRTAVDDNKAIQRLVAEGDAAFSADRDYFFYHPPLPTSHPDKIEVVDIFWYGCPSCYHFKDTLEAWHKQLGNDVIFIRKPVAIRRDWLNHAKIWLTAKQLGIEEKLHQEIFDAIHKDRLQLDSIDDISKFFAKAGIDEMKFRQVFNSSEIHTEIQALNEEIAKYKISVTPSMVINGRYLIPGTDDDQKMLKIADYLIAKERLAKQKH